MSINVNASLWTVLDNVRKEEALGRAKLLSASVGKSSPDHPARKKKMKQRRDQLRSILVQWRKVSISDYFNMVVGHYNEFKD